MVKLEIDPSILLIFYETTDFLFKEQMSTIVESIKDVHIPFTSVFSDEALQSSEWRSSLLSSPSQTTSSELITLQN